MAVGNVAGLASGIDWNETIRMLMQIERRPITFLETRRTALNQHSSSWGTIQSKLTNLQSIAQGMDTPNEFISLRVESSDSSVVTADASSLATTGVHSLLINQIATAHIIVHEDGWADLDSTPVNNSGSPQYFSYQYGTTSVTVEVPDGTTLRQLINLINNDPNNPGVTASVINDGSGGASPYHLVLRGDQTGEDYTITILDTAENPTTLGDGNDFDPSTWEITQQAQNAQLRVDGFPDPSWGWPTPWIESATNDITDIIPGLTLHLKDDSAGNTILLSVSLDVAAIRERVSSLISAYNDLRATLAELTRYDPQTQTSGNLIQDSQVRFIINELSSLVSSTIPGTSESDTYRSLREVGVKVTTNGRLELDEEEFEDALTTDPVGVARLFAIDTISSSGFVSVVSTANATQGGTHSFTITYDATGKIDPSGTNTIAGENATLYGNTILAGASGSSAEGLILMLTNPGNGPNSLSGTIQVYKGFASLLLDKIDHYLEPDEGVVAISRERINDAIKNLDERIRSWERRLQTIEDNYRKRFQAMEALIGQMRQVGNYLTSALTSLS